MLIYCFCVFNICFLYKNIIIFASTCLPRFSFAQRAQGELFIYKKMSKKLYSKTAITYADQLNQLKVRGLIIEDEQKALHLLEVISYYRLSGY